jgi:alpha-N-arabinofuranosidase
VTGLTQTWKQYDVTLTTDRVEPTAKARFALTVDRPGTIWFSLVSLFPPTCKGPNIFVGEWGA